MRGRGSCWCTALIAGGDRDTVIREFFRDIAGYGDAAVEELARSPIWDARRDFVPTLSRELHAELDHRLDREALAERGTPTLLLVGSDSPDWAVRSVAAYARRYRGRRHARSTLRATTRP